MKEAKSDCRLGEFEEGREGGVPILEEGGGEEGTKEEGVDSGKERRKGVLEGF